MNTLIGDDSNLQAALIDPQSLSAFNGFSSSIYIQLSNVVRVQFKKTPALWMFTDRGFTPMVQGSRTLRPVPFSCP